MLQLKKSLEFTEWVQPIALPAAMEETEAGTDCTVTGWGTLSVSFLYLMLFQMIPNSQYMLGLINFKQSMDPSSQS